ncbi:hypothetical protein L2E82_05625 [Cichorium intybus]|uniref:Uncharacterized protein n=1 Tax=Cichorium intybus TaxID=13427 RepID=A0ACB9H891_CICIN|nr:hypothetical protein L2E82_05625 [Cichorium intybus]
MDRQKQERSKDAVSRVRQTDINKKSRKAKHTIHVMDDTGSSRMDDESWENDNKSCSNSDDSCSEEDVETEKTECMSC